MPLVADLIARAVGRSAGVGGRALLLGLGREVHRQYQRRAAATATRSAEPIPHGPIATAMYTAWLCGLVVFVLVFLNVHLLFPADRPAALFRIATGAILLVEGLALVVERPPFRRLLAARLAGRSRRGGRRRLVGAALIMLGIAWVAFGVLNVLRGALALVT